MYKSLKNVDLWVHMELETVRKTENKREKIENKLVLSYSKT